jgi:hypothetical protein
MFNFLCFASVMLFTESSSSQTGQTRLPLHPYASCLACPTHAFVPHTPTRASHRTLLTPRAANASHYVPSHIEPLAWTRVAHSQGPWTMGDLRAMALSFTPASSSASTSLHWTAASRWAHIITVCFMCFSCMLHMFYLNVVKVDLVLHMLQ